MDRHYSGQKTVKTRGTAEWHFWLFQPVFNLYIPTGFILSHWVRISRYFSRSLICTSTGFILSHWARGLHYPVFFQDQWVNHVTYIPDVKSTIALRQEYSAASTWIFLNFSIWSVKILMLSMNDTILSEFKWFACIPAVASNVGLFSGIGHCAAFNTNNSLHVSRRRATWSVTARSGNNGMFLAHSTAENSSLRKKYKNLHCL